MYYLKICFKLLIRKTINAVTVMLAVMRIFQKTMNAVPVMPVKIYSTISCFDAIAGFCGRLDFLWFFGWCWNSKHICSGWFFKFINSNFYVTTKSWQAHQKVSLDELVWKKWVSEIFIDAFIKLSLKPFQNPVLWHLFVLLK